MSMAEQTPAPQWLERANRMSLIGRVLTGTIHDVNNALQVVSGSVDLLQTVSPHADAATRRVAAIGTHSGRATGLIADLTAFVKEPDVPVGPVDLYEMGERALVLRRHSLNRLRLTPVIEGDRIAVQASRKRVLQILLNLIVNAERALAGVADAALVLRVAREAEWGTFTVKDNGPGFSDDRAEAIFMPRLSQAGSVEDLGIGLSVSRWLADRDHGTLTATSTAGAAFTLKLPASGR